METKYSKTIVILISLSMTSFADSDSDAKTIYYTSENDGVGNYEYRFETSNGISRQENGIVENAGQPNAYLRVAGSYFYPGTRWENRRSTLRS
ncbi:Endocuticle structural glycoprotein ABD-5 [Eumeta japonica]|uniref:Endocuticle structural glycoprotein ABD-5 n=1 Tax=Eumeta variegata TaxID=151549 RepID=A0A4C1ZXG7_EUMVA|nr:Endocuticle structural glycoprotein ABD-5 [Eumeta japonica]